MRAVIDVSWFNSQKSVSEGDLRNDKCRVSGFRNWKSLLESFLDNRVVLVKGFEELDAEDWRILDDDGGVLQFRSCEESDSIDGDVIVLGGDSVSTTIGWDLASELSLAGMRVCFSDDFSALALRGGFYDKDKSVVNKTVSEKDSSAYCLGDFMLNDAALYQSGKLLNLAVLSGVVCMQGWSVFNDLIGTCRTLEKDAESVLEDLFTKYRLREWLNSYEYLEKFFGQWVLSKRCFDRDGNFLLLLRLCKDDEMLGDSNFLEFMGKICGGYLSSVTGASWRVRIIADKKSNRRKNAFKRRCLVEATGRIVDAPNDFDQLKKDVMNGNELGLRVTSPWARSWRSMIMDLSEVKHPCISADVQCSLEDGDVQYEVC